MSWCREVVVVEVLGGGCGGGDALREVVASAEEGSATTMLERVLSLEARLRCAMAAVWLWCGLDVARCTE